MKAEMLHEEYGNGAMDGELSVAILKMQNKESTSTSLY